MMKKNIRDTLETWPRSFIRDSDLAKLLQRTVDSRYAVVKRALKAGILVRIRQGLYLIASKVKQKLPDEFELALLMYEPSIISLESALSYHGWIPEGVYTTTCVSPKRAQEFKTPLGVFSYKRVPDQGFYLGVERIATTTGTIMVADPWRALADFMYTRHKSWNTLEELEADLRIDPETLMASDTQLLEKLRENYPSPRVRRGLKKFLREITKKMGSLS